MAKKPTYEELEKRVRDLEKELIECRQNEEVLRENGQRMELALEGGELGVWDWYVQTNKVFFNRRWAEMLGYSLDEIETDLSSWERLVHPDDLPRITKELNDHLEGRTKVYEGEHRLKSKSGGWKWILGRGKVFERDNDGKPVRASGTNLDITEHKLAEIELKKHREELEELVQCKT
jgi:PAS domain S-box-containing protein